MSNVIGIGQTWTTVCDHHMVELARECTKLDVSFTDYIEILHEGVSDVCRFCNEDITVQGAASYAYDEAVRDACN